MKKIILYSLLVLAFCSCHQGSETAQSIYHAFPQVQVPSVYGNGAEASKYAMEHYWDSFFSKGGVTDSLAVLGVKKPELEQALSTYIGALEDIPLADAQALVSGLFSGIEKCQASQQEGSLAYLRFTEMVARYLYDPNSPIRSEDLFLPFVRGLAESPWTRDDMRAGYRYQAKMCALNQFGQQVPDFEFKDAKGRRHSLYGIKADYVMLFFSNPGCNACKEIIDQICSRPYIETFIADKRLVVVSIYIDLEVDKWLEYEPNYPRSWISGYDHLYRIREEHDYDIRAIPSLYLLDAEKRVIMKDAPTERVMLYLDNLNNQYYGNN